MFQVSQTATRLDQSSKWSINDLRSPISAKLTKEAAVPTFEYNMTIMNMCMKGTIIWPN
jgi:hypothetical protein